MRFQYFSTYSVDSQHLNGASNQSWTANKTQPADPAVLELQATNHFDSPVMAHINKTLNLRYQNRITETICAKTFLVCMCVAEDQNKLAEI